MCAPWTQSIYLSFSLYSFLFTALFFRVIVDDAAAVATSVVCVCAELFRSRSLDIPPVWHILLRNLCQPYISSAFSLMPFHVIQYVVIRNADEYALKTVHTNNKRCRRCQATDSTSHSFNVIVQIHCADNKSPAHSSGMKKSTKTIKRCNVILLVYLSACLKLVNGSVTVFHMRFKALKHSK